MKQQLAVQAACQSITVFSCRKEFPPFPRPCQKSTKPARQDIFRDCSPAPWRTLAPASGSGHGQQSSGSLFLHIPSGEARGMRDGRPGSVSTSAPGTSLAKNLWSRIKRLAPHQALLIPKTRPVRLHIIKSQSASQPFNRRCRSQDLQARQ